jgi:hypothetical protein
MRVLLDECLDPRFARLFARHECTSVKAMGWLGKANGALLQAASGEFDAFVTIDRNLPHQQNLATFDLAVIVIREPQNDPGRADELVRLVEQLLDTSPERGAHWIDLC